MASPLDVAVQNRLDSYLDDQDLAAAWFARPNNVRWLTGGDTVVDRESEVGVAAVGYDGDFQVVTNNIEAPRLRDEELPDSVPIETFPWYDGSLAEAVADASPTPAAADFEIPDFETVEAASLRTPLTDHGIETYRELGSETGRVVEKICREAESTDTERAVAARLTQALAARGIESPVVLVGSEQRVQEYRHYTPTEAELGGYALVSVTTQRGGLHASCTRTIAFDPPEWLDERHDLAASVETTALAATREAATADGTGETGGTSETGGRDGAGNADESAGTAGDVFAAIQEAYAAGGFPGEWKHHHQGGAAGYAGREWKATPDADDPVQVPMGYAWNPTVQGAKSEDTALVTREGIEFLTRTGEWPTRSAEAVGYDLALERPAPLASD